MSSPARLKVAWITDFPIEWMPEVPEEFQALPKQHSRSWQRVLLEEFQNHAQLELHVVVLRRNIKRDIFFQKNGVSFYVLKLFPATREQTFYWLETFRIKKTLQRICPDIVHAWGTERGAHVVAKRLGYPYLVTIQGLLTWYSELVPLNIYERFAAWLEKLALPGAPLVTTESSFAAQYLKDHFPDLRVFQAEHAPNQVFHEIVRKPQISPVRFLFVGYLGYRKGADLLLPVLEQLETEIDFELLVVGDIEAGFEQRLEGLKARPVWKRVKMRRHLTPAEVAEELSRATMLVFPTRADTSPNAVKEAVVAGVPVVASAIGGITDYVLPGKNGFTFPSENVPEFVARLREACRHPLFSQGRVDDEALKQVRAYLSPRRMEERFLEAYEIVAKRRKLTAESALIARDLLGSS
jgi:glycosyltransferase involved in cell wall biosynthesis